MKASNRGLRSGRSSLKSNGLKRKPISQKVKKPRKKLEDKTAQELTKVADEYFSKYIRLRDSKYIDGTWVGECITCPRPLSVRSQGKWRVGAQNGHFITRGCHQLRFDELNCNLQCSHCNAWRDKEDMLEAYRKALALKYGEDTVTELKQLSKAEDAYKRKTKPELLQIIADCKLYIKHTEENPNHYA